MGKVMGQGTYGVVKKATSRRTGDQCAVKMINKKHILTSPVLTAYLESELEVLQQVQAPFVI